MRKSFMLLSLVAAAAVAAPVAAQEQVQKRLDQLQERIAKLEKQLAAQGTGQCDCPQGGTCVCPGQCPCPQTSSYAQGYWIQWPNGQWQWVASQSAGQFYGCVQGRCGASGCQFGDPGACFSGGCCGSGGNCGMGGCSGRGCSGRGCGRRGR